MKMLRGAGIHRLLLFGLVVVLGALACARGDTTPAAWKVIEPWVGIVPSPTPTMTPTATLSPLMRLFPTPLSDGVERPTPTPNPLRPAPEFRTQTDIYIVQPGDSLGGIAQQFAIGSQQLMNANNLFNPDYLAVGQVLTVPPSDPLPAGPSFKIIPDSEAVYGPSTALFDTIKVVRQWDGALQHYHDEIEGEDRSGAELVQLVAERYSVNPRLLLALLEYQAGWLTQPQVSPTDRLYPMGNVDPTRQGMFAQLSWAADQLNAGFYLWRAGWLGPFLLADGRVAPPGPGINAGTAAVQNLFAHLVDSDSWPRIVGPDGFIKVYRSLFGDPFQWAVEPLVPPDLEQPDLQLPFEPEDTWSFTSGPHGAWGTGSGWAALDFAPPGYALGCVQSNVWIVAAAGAPVVRTDLGIVVQDLDEDGHEGTGWDILYLHIESRDRVQEGSILNAGDRIGHPSCEGGVSNGTHLHLARKYNGVWITADGPLPFVMDGWVSAGTGAQYDGTMTRDEITLEACSCRDEGNQIGR
ncbi:MAG: LysM peptidoglycan-binding domain-containing protein [Anaerolineales bacterium]